MATDKPATDDKLVSTLFVIGLTILVFGASFGILAHDIGLTALQATTMSLTVMAGASQFATVGALDAGASLVMAGLAGATLALRYLPLGVAAATVLDDRRGASRWLHIYLLTDPGVVVGHLPGEGVDGRRYRLTGIVMTAMWVVGTASAATFAARLPDVETLGLDAAYPALFLALMAAELRRDRRALRAALGGAGLAALAVPLTPPGVPVVIAAAGLLAALSRDDLSDVVRGRGKERGA